MATREDSRRYLENWQDEIDSAAEYRAMAESEPDARLARVYGNLARMEEVHITFWEDKLRQAGVEVGSRRPSWRSRVLRWIGRRLGPDLVLATIAAREEADQNYYITQPETTDTRMAAQERWHAKVLKQLVLTQPRGLRGNFWDGSKAGIAPWAGTRSGQRSSGRTTVSARTSAWSWAWPEPPPTRS